MPRRFRNRSEAGRVLANDLLDYAHRDNVIVLGLPRGGVPVAFEVALALHAPLDVFVVRKLGLPHHPELAMGAVATGGATLIDSDTIRHFNVTRAQLDAVIAAETSELERRQREYRGDMPSLDVHDRTAILVDDGLATGASMRVAVAALRAERPAKIVVGVPIAPPDTCKILRNDADDVVCAMTPEPFIAVGLWYEDFSETTDEEVRDLLARSKLQEQMQ